MQSGLTAFSDFLFKICLKLNTDKLISVVWVHLSFLYVAHTHEDVDAKFSQISKIVRKENVVTILKRLIKGMYDINTWLLPHINDVEGHFSFPVTMKG